MNIHPAQLAYNAILTTMERGSAKDGCDDSWQEKSAAYHLTRAIRHAITAHMIHMGLEQDGEGKAAHLQNAMTRLSMAMWKMLLH